jgi:hypothetical protein
MTFEEYQALATKAPLALRNNRTRIDLPILGLQEGAGKIGSLFTAASSLGKFSPTQEQRVELRDGLSDLLWCIALICDESEIRMQTIADHSISQLQERCKDLDPNER